MENAGVQSGSRKKYLVLFVVLVLVVGFALSFSGSGKKFLKGNFGFCFDPTDISCAEQVIDLSDVKENVSRIPESELYELPLPESDEARRAKEQRQMSDDTRAYYFDENTDVVDEDGKSKAQKDKEKKQEEWKKQQEEAKNRIVVSVSKGFPKVQTLDPKKISPETPATAASFQLCTEGKEDAVIKGIQFDTWGSSGEKYVQFYVENKPTSAVTKIDSNWNGDFLTVDNLSLPAGTCTNVSLKLTGVSSEAEWHFFYVKALSSNLKAGYLYYYPDGTSGFESLGALSPTTTPSSFVVFKPETHLNIGSSDTSGNPLVYKTYDVLPMYANKYASNLHHLGGFTFATKKNSTASVKSVKIRLKGNKGKNLSVQLLKKLTFLPGYLNTFPGLVDIPDYSEVLTAPVITFEPDKEVTIVLDTAIPYSSVLNLFILNQSVMKEPTEFHFELTDVETATPVKWKSPAPLPAEKVMYVEKIEPVKQMQIKTFLSDGVATWSGLWWSDSSQAKASIAKNGSVTVGGIDMYASSVMADGNPFTPKVQVKNLKIKLGGTFNDPLSVRSTYFNGSTWVKTEKTLVAKNGILEIPNLTFTGDKAVELELLEYPLDPKFTFSIKPVVVSLEATYVEDSEYTKKDEKIPLVTPNFEDGWKLIPFVLPHSFGILTFGPTILANTSSDTKPGLTYVDIAKLPKGQASEFEVHKSCFKAQGSQTISGFTFQHVVRDTSPFSNIKLVYGNTEVFLKPNDWSKEYAVFMPTTPLSMGHNGYECYTLRVIDPKEAVEDFWFALKEIDSVIGEFSPNMTPAPGSGPQEPKVKYPVPVYNGVDLLKDKPIKGSVYTFK